MTTTIGDTLELLHTITATMPGRFTIEQTFSRIDGQFGVRIDIKRGNAIVDTILYEMDKDTLITRLNAEKQTLQDQIDAINVDLATVEDL